MALNALGLGLLFTAKDLASGVMKRVREGFTATRMSAEELQSAQKSAAESFAIGAKVFGAGLGMLGGLGLVTQQAVDFGHEIAKIRTVIDEASFSTEDLRKTTMGLAASYGLDALQEAGALYETISAGITDADAATALVETANEFAVGGTTSLAGAVDVLTSAVNTYADQGLTAKKASDLMFTAIAAGKTTAEELSHSLGEVAPTAHAAGVGFDELQAAIAALTVQGIKTPQAVTALNAMMSNIMKPTADAEKEAKRLGIAFDATALKTQGLRGVLMQLVGNTKVNNDTFTNLFGSVEGVKGALTLTASGGAKFNEIINQMADSAGATGKAFDIMANTTKFQEDRFKALSKNALILIGEVLEPLVASVMKVVNNVVEGFTKMPKSMREFLVKGAAVVAVVTTIVGAVMAAKAAIAVASFALAGVGVSLSSVVLGVVAIVAVFATLKHAIDSNLGGIGDRFNGFVESVSLAWEALKQLFTQGGFSGAVREEFMKGASAPINFAIRIWLAFNRVKEFLSQVATGFMSVIDAAGPSFAALGAAASRIGDVFSKLWETVDPAEAGSAFDSLSASGKSVGAVFGRIVVAIVNIATVLGDLVGGALEFVGPAFIDLGSTVIDAIGEIVGSIGSVAKSLGLADNAVDGSAGGWVALGQTIGKVIKHIVELVAGMIRSVGYIWKGFFNIIGGIVDLFTGNFATGLQKIINGVISIIVNLLAEIVGIAAKMGDIVFGTNMSKSIEDWKIKFNQTQDALLTNATTPAAESKPIAGFGPTALTAEEAAQLNASTMPAIASMPGDNMSVDTDAIGDATARGVSSALKNMPPQTVHATLMLPDGSVLAESVSKAQTSSDSRNFTPSTIVSE